ncbi:MAG TPA: glutamate 5-kinase, partial [Pseudoxanthomonas sp.]|nr:glutamate 5-kinase [Pseudoxanthomonas sp.]
MATLDASDSTFVRQPLPPWRRAVLKVGSSLLTLDGEGLSERHAGGLARFVGDSLAACREVVIVSSGAVSAGRAVLQRSPRTGAALAERQALAALGQAR